MTLILRSIKGSKLTISEMDGNLTYLQGIANVGTFGISIDGQGSVISTGSQGYVILPYAATITNWRVVADQAGSVVVDLKRSGTSIIGAGNKPTLTSAQRANAAVSGWTSTSISADDEIEFVINSSSTITRLNLFIEVTKI